MHPFFNKKEVFALKKELGLYIHIPFCKTLCHYCDFCKFINQKEDVINKYIDHLIKEIQKYSSYFDDITSIYIGGGTPNSIDLKALKRLFKALETINPIEYSIETNVEFINQNFIDLLKETKVNRISIGVQSFDDILIKEMNRFHNKNMCITAVNLLKSNGYNNINIDMIYGIKNQTIKQLESDLKTLQILDIQHVSYYSLILEEKSVYGRKYEDLDALIEEDLEASMNELVINTLNEYGFNHYEISNFSKENKESYHNKLYWKRSEYIGVGASATGYLNNITTSNSNILSGYYNGEKEEFDTTIEEQKQEFFWLGLRIISGVDLSLYTKKFNENPMIKFNIQKLIDMNLLQLNGDILKLTTKGILLGNTVFRHFID